MKTLFYILLISLLSTGCVKILAHEEHSDVNRTSLHGRYPGASAKDLLSDGQYKSLTIEMQFMRGFKPQPQTLDRLRNFLEKYLHKPGGIYISLKEIDTGSSNSLYTADVLAIERINRSQYITKNKMAIYFLFTNSDHPTNKILGMAYNNTSAVIYGKAIQEYAKSKGGKSLADLESAVVLHEMGHLLGLVHKESLKGHEDDAHPDHCKNKRCLMYYEVETKSTASKIFLNGQNLQLDGDCVEALIENGGKPLQIKSSD